MRIAVYTLVHVQCAGGPKGQRRRAATAPSAPWAILLVQPSPEIGDRPNPSVESGKVAAQWRPRSWGVARNRIPVRPAHNSLESAGCRGAHSLDDGDSGMTLPHLMPSPCIRRGVGIGGTAR